MSRLGEKARTMTSLLGAGHGAVVLNEIRRWLYSDSHFYGLCRDLAQPFDAPEAKIRLTVRPLEQSDIPKLFKLDEPGITGIGVYERMNRLNLLRANFGTCYVAVTPENDPCYLQWLFGPSENTQIQAYFRGVFPLLAADEVLLEDAFTPEAYRGLGIMGFAMSQISEKGRAWGARKAITFVDPPRVPSLKGCKKAGYVPYQLRRDRWRLFRQQITFTPLPAGTPYPFELESPTENVRSSIPLKH